MPRNYDEMRKDDDRDFVIRGETFTVKRGRPEILGPISDLDKRFAEVTTHMELVEASEERLKLLIDDSNGAVARWDALRVNEDDPITYGEIMDLSRWALEVITGLPTRLASASEAGPGRTGRSSKAGSP